MKKEKVSIEITNNIPKLDVEILDYIKSSLGFQVEIIEVDTFNLKNKVILVTEKQIAFQINSLTPTKSPFENKINLETFLECQKKQIQLIQIWEDEWQNKQKVVKSMIAHKLGVNQDNKVYARKTNLKLVSQSERSKFLDNNHIQGSVGGSIKYGLYDKQNNLVAVGLFKHRNQQEAELVRYATSKTVVGGMGKIIKAFIKNNPNYNYLVTFADHQVSNGDLYEKLGFEAVDTLNPDYKYIVDNTREHKFNYRLKRFKNDENLIYVEGKTEAELAKLNNINRVWDAGKTKYQLKINNKQLNSLQLHPNSIIKTTTGHKSAKDIIVGDQFFNNSGEINNVVSTVKTQADMKQSFLEIKTVYDNFGNIVGKEDQIMIYDIDSKHTKLVSAEDIQIGDHIAIIKPQQSEVVPTQYDLADFITKDNNHTSITVTENQIIEQTPRKQSFDYSLNDISRNLNLGPIVAQSYYKDLKGIKKWNSIHKQTIDNYLLQHFDTIEQWLEYYEERKTITRIIPRFINLNPDFWYFWGIFVGDGHIQMKNLQRKCYVLVENINESHIVSSWQKIFGTQDGHIIREYKETSTRRLEGTSVVIANLFRSLLKDWKAASSKHVPDYYLSLSTVNKKALIEGLWESDGTSFNKKDPSFVSSSEALAQQTHLLLLNLGIHNHIKKRQSFDHRFDPPTLSTRFDISCPTNFVSKLSPVNHEKYLFFPVKSVKENISSNDMVTIQSETNSGGYMSSTCTIFPKKEHKPKLKDHKPLMKKHTISKSESKKINSLTIPLQQLREKQTLDIHTITDQKVKIEQLKTIKKQDLNTIELAYFGKNYMETIDWLKQENFNLIKLQTGIFLELNLDQSINTKKRWDLVDYIPTIKSTQTSFEYDDNFIYEKSINSKSYPLSLRDVAKALGVPNSSIHYFSKLEGPAKTSKQKRIEEYLLSKNFTVEEWRRYVAENSYNINKIPRFINLNSDLMSLLGLFAGNGSILGKPKSPYYIALCEPEKENIIRSKWEKVFGESVLSSYDIHPSFKNNDYRVNTFEVHSVVLNNFLKDIIGDLVSGQGIPGWIVQHSSLDLLWDFVRSMWTVKGNMSSEHSTSSFYSPSQKVSSDLTKILLRLGIPSRSDLHTSIDTKGSVTRTAYNFVNTKYFFVEQNQLYVRVTNNEDIEL